MRALEENTPLGQHLEQPVPIVVFDNAGFIADGIELTAHARHPLDLMKMQTGVKNTRADY